MLWPVRSRPLFCPCSVLRSASFCVSFVCLYCMVLSLDFHFPSMSYACENAEITIVQLLFLVFPALSLHASPPSSCHAHHASFMPPSSCHALHASFMPPPSCHALHASFILSRPLCLFHASFIPPSCLLHPILPFLPPSSCQALHAFFVPPSSRLHSSFIPPSSYPLASLPPCLIRALPLI